MKSMEQMAHEMIARCEAEQDESGFPMAYIRGFPPVVQIIRSQEQLDRVRREDERYFKVVLWILGAGVVLALATPLLLLFR